MIETETPVGHRMKITVRRDELVQRLAVRLACGCRPAPRCRSSRDPDSLRRRRARARGGRDMELSLRASVPAQIEGEGSIVVPGRRLVELAKLLPSETWRSSTGPRSRSCTSPPALRATRCTRQREDFPRLPELDAATTFAVDREALLETINRVSRSASRDESRPGPDGILARFEAGKLVMAATDSYRLSVKETEIGGQVPELEAIIPARALQGAERIAQSGDEVELGVHENQVVFSADGVSMTTRRIDGQFPNYRQLLPEAFEHELALPRNELLRRRARPQ